MNQRVSMNYGATSELVCNPIRTPSSVTLFSAAAAAEVAVCDSVSHSLQCKLQIVRR